MASLPEIVALIACSLGAGMGLYGLINPQWAARLVRLRAAEGQPGGFAEFRATYGGMFLFTHAAAIFGVLATGPSFSAIFCFPVAALWAGAGIGRTLSMLLDGTRTPFNLMSVVFELGMAVAIGLPLILFLT